MAAVPVTAEARAAAGRFDADDFVDVRAPNGKWHAAQVTRNEFSRDFCWMGFALGVVYDIVVWFCGRFARINWNQFTSMHNFFSVCALILSLTFASRPLIIVTIMFNMCISLYIDSQILSVDVERATVIAQYADGVRHGEEELTMAVSHHRMRIASLGSFTSSAFWSACVCLLCLSFGVQ